MPMKRNRKSSTLPKNMNPWTDVNALSFNGMFGNNWIPGATGGYDWSGQANFSNPFGAAGGAQATATGAPNWPAQAYNPAAGGVQSAQPYGAPSAMQQYNSAMQSAYASAPFNTSQAFASAPFNSSQAFASAPFGNSSPSYNTQQFTPGPISAPTQQAPPPNQPYTGYGGRNF